MSFSRRDFFQYSAAVSALMAINPSALLARTERPTPSRLSWQAYRTTTQEGCWTLSDVEGTIPADFQGDFLKIGPGTKDVFSQKLNHYFDGDGYISRFQFRDGSIQLQARFVQTPQRMEEQAEGKMLYHEFGTQAPARTQKGRKNQPNINLVPWDGSLLALSEGGHPAALDPATLDFKSFTDFGGSLPKNVSFSAHPKFDPVTGHGFAFGIHQGMSRALKVYRMNSQSKQLEELYSLNQSQVYLIHDMAMTADHLVFIIPPLFFRLTDLVLGRGPLAEVLRFDKNKKSRLVILDKRGKDKPIEIDLPSSMVFHHGNATLIDGVLKLQTFLAPDGAIFDLIKDWSNPDWPRVNNSVMHEITVDVKNKKVLGNERLLADHDFPVFNTRLSGQPSRYVYATGMTRPEDPMGFDRITKYDLQTRAALSMPMPAHRVCGESLFVPRPQATQEDDGWVMFQGFDANRDESFFEILDARDMKFVARVWAGMYLPVGFHGAFVSA